MKPSFPSVRSHTFRSGDYTIAWRAPRASKDVPEGHSLYGLWDPNRKKLWIYPSTDPYELLDTVLDETTHANHPDLDNDSVREGVIATMKLLRRMGMKVSFDGG